MTVHRLGLWHKSAQVYVFDQHQRLLIARRSAQKDLYANLWDYSVGEHLQPGETFAAGARRGLLEELGITGATELTPLGGVRRIELQGVTSDGSRYLDRELQQAYRVDYAGHISFSPDEVADIEHVSRTDLTARIAAKPADFTPSLLRDFSTLVLF